MALLFDFGECNNEQSKKVSYILLSQMLDILSILENDYFGIFTKRELIPENMQEIPNLQLMKNKYK